jgi:dTDP-glucose 4,6-dehydratase
MSDSPILVTGAAGFIGSHLVERLLRDGNRVRAFVRYNSRAGVGWLDDLPSGLKEDLEVFCGDIVDHRRVAEAVSGCRLVYHLAALIGIPYSYHAPVSYLKVNVEGTMNVLEGARSQMTPPPVIVTSTSEVYGTAESVPISVDHPLKAQSPYAASKVAADQFSLSYARSFELPVTVARPFNTFGPRQSERAVIPTIIAQLLADQPVVRLGSTTPTRDLNFVSNAVDAFVGLAENPQKTLGQVIQFGLGSEISIGDLASLLMKVTGIEKPIETEEARVRPKASEVERLLCDNSTARDAIGYEPSVDLEEGLRRTVEWLREKGTESSRAGTYTL